MTLRLRWLVLTAIACHHGPPAATLFPAGDEHDEGHGQLAQASTRFLTEDEVAAAAKTTPDAQRRRTQYGGDAYGADSYGAYGGDPYGGGYANWHIPVWNYANPTRAPHYNATTNLTGAIEGVVSWTGALPPRVTTPCGAIDNPSVRIGEGRSVGGVLVYIDRIDVGRTLPNYGRPVSVGGVIAKRGCVLLPAVQIMTPLPAPLAIHGDAERSKVRVTQPNGVMKPFELQEAGRVQLELPIGVTRVDGDKLTSAWVLGLDTPYYAITDDSGRFRIDELAAGTYDVIIWQAPLASATDSKITYGAPVIVKRTIKVDPAKPAQLNVALGH